MSPLDLVLFSTGSAISCLGICFLTGEVLLVLKARKLQQLKEKPTRIQEEVNNETDKLISLISQIRPDDGLEALVDECGKLKNPDITTQDTREITTLVLTRLFTKACDDQLRSDVISAVIDLEMADDKKQIALKLAQNAQTKENSSFIKLVESINQRFGGIK